MSEVTDRRILVPVGDSVTVRSTVAHAVREAMGEEGGDAADVVHFVFPVSWQNRDLNTESAEDAEELLDRVTAWVREDAGVEESRDLPFELTTAVIGTEEYLFSPRDYADTILEYARENDLHHIVLDPEFEPGGRAPLLSPLEAELDLASDVTYEEAPGARPVRARGLLGRTPNLGAFATIFGVCFLFYQVLGGFAGTFDYVTGAISAAIVAAILSGITFHRGVRPVRALRSAVRWIVYLPLLFWEIAKANVAVAYVVLHPSMPIDPSVERFRPAVPLGLPVTTLANSITLTPGTVTIEVRNREFHVHALTQSARDGLYDGGLERAVRFVFFGRAAARIPSPRERGETARDAERNESSDADSGDDSESGRQGG